MKRQFPTVNAPQFAKLVWSNILRWQYLKGITDSQLCQLLGVTSRTLLNYKTDPSALTMRQLQAILDGLGIEPDALIKS